VTRAPADYDEDAYAADAQKVSELMEKMSACYPGYSRMVIALACSRTIAAMYGPAKDETRADFVRRFPNYIRSMWRAMDAAIGRER
jgi:hypothetical protein